MASLRHDGSLPTLTTKSNIFAFKIARFLSAAELSAVMGFNIPRCNFASCSETWWRRRLGLDMHVSTAGAMLLALVVVPLARGIRPGGERFRERVTGGWWQSSVDHIQ